MEELKRAITDAAMLASEPPETEPRLYPDLQEAAEKWATHSLRCYSGAALDAALMISTAIVDFIEEISNP